MRAETRKGISVEGATVSEGKEATVENEGLEMD